MTTHTVGSLLLQVAELKRQLERRDAHIRSLELLIEALEQPATVPAGLVDDGNALLAEEIAAKNREHYMTQRAEAAAVRGER